MGTVDSEGRARATELDPTKGITEFFDPLDVEADLRADAATQRLLAIELPTEARDLVQTAASVRAEATALDNEASRLIESARKRSGSVTKALERRAKELRQEAGELGKKAKVLDKAGEAARVPDADELRELAEKVDRRRRRRWPKR